MKHGEVVKSHFNTKYHDYDVLIRKLIPKYDELHKHVVDVIDYPANKSINILDLGIGTGQTALALLGKYPKAHIDGVDISRKMIALGQERLKDYLDKVRFSEQDINDFTAQDKYNACVAVLCVHHLNQEQKQTLFRKVFEWLKPNGIFVIGDIITFDTEQETKEKENEWKNFLTNNLGTAEGNYWFENYQEEDLPSTISEQLLWLKTAGFMEVKSTWKNMNYGVLYARKLIGTHTES
jgi:tRNA (cmo5U34)-methyltransferase